MNDDLIKRLRDLGDHASFEPHMHHAAADRIEELSNCVAVLGAKMAKLRAERNHANDVTDAAVDEIERLKAQADAVWNEAIEAAAQDASLHDCSDGSDDFTIGIQQGYRDAVGQITDSIRSLKRPVKGESHE